MSLKTLGRKASARMGRQILTVKTHSPVLLLGAGVIGVCTSTFLACRATLKLSDVIAKGEADLEKVDVTSEVLDEEDVKKASFGVKLRTAIEVAKLYAPSVAIGLGSLGMIVGGHVILKKRHAAAVGAYAILSKGFQDYRGRVVADQGKEKDLEYMFGVGSKEIVEQDEHGDKVTTINGLDQEAIRANEESMYARVFAPTRADGTKNPKWSDIPNQNQFLLQSIQSQMNDLLELDGVVFLSDVYELLGFKPTRASRVVGWVKNPKDQEGDFYIDFGVWNEGVYEGKKWLNGDKDAILLDFNVQGDVSWVLDEQKKAAV